MNEVVFPVIATGLRSGLHVGEQSVQERLVFPVIATGLRSGKAAGLLVSAHTARLPGHRDRAP